MTPPRFDMHCHLEGSAPPALVAELARTNGMTLPAGLVDDGGRFAWRGFVDFLRAYDRASACIRRGGDYARVTYEYLRACAADGAVYAEFFLSPDHAAHCGLAYAAQLEAVTGAIADAERDFAIVARVVVTCIRHLGPDNAVDVARLAVSLPHPWVVGFGMAGDENRYAAADFAPAFRIARDGGLRCSCHAAEAAGPDSLRAVLDALPVERIGHGVRAIEDPALVERLVRDDIALEICVGSNLAIGVYPSVAEHPLPRLLEAGCRVMLGSDDPPWFDTSIGAEYRRLGDAFGLDDAVIAEINRTAVERAFCDEDTRARLRQRLAV